MHVAAFSKHAAWIRHKYRRPWHCGKAHRPTTANKTSEKEIRRRQKDSAHLILHRCKKRILPATGSQTLTKKHTSRTFFASIRHCRDSFSAQQKIIRLKAIFQCPQNLRATCTKRRKNDFLLWRRDAENPVFPRRWKPDGLKKEKQNDSGNARQKDT